ncbi:transcriptional regulator [Thiopseudomonas alkaliphila]|nr:transcriptional regulator [Thiopseudomonas alkaliphila]
MSTYRLVCPHCHSRMRIRTSEGMHILLRVAYMQCTNEACSWSARGEFLITHEMGPSGMPNPDVDLPIADSAMRRHAMKKEDDKQNDLFDA